MNNDGHKPKVVLAMSELFSLLAPEEESRHLEFAQAAEAVGVEGVFVSEHVVMGPSAGSLGRMPNPRGFVRPGMQDPATPWPAPLIKLAAIAGATSRLRLISAALLAPLRHPLVVAKELATLDLISDGRLSVLPSVSWHKEEYQALEVDFATRGRRLDEHLAIWQSAWNESPISFQGEFFQFADAYVSPQPVPGRIKVWFGGTALRKSLLDRITTYGYGLFLGFPMTIDDRAVLAEAMAEAGRSADELEVMGWAVPRLPPDGVADIEATLKEMVPLRVEQGCDLIAVKPASYLDDPEEFPAFCEQVVATVDSMF